LAPSALTFVLFAVIIYCVPVDQAESKDIIIYVLGALDQCRDHDVLATILGLLSGSKEKSAAA
jgi:hypothetical protein